MLQLQYYICEFLIQYVCNIIVFSIEMSKYKEIKLTVVLELQMFKNIVSILRKFDKISNFTT